jgi:hypothetical protein
MSVDIDGPEANAAHEQHAMHHFLTLARQGAAPGASRGQILARALAHAILENSTGLDGLALDGAAEFLRRAPLNYQAARTLAGFDEETPA